MLDELVGLDAPLELVVVEEVVVDAVGLPEPRPAGGGRDRQLELAAPAASSVRMSVPLPTPDGPVITKTFGT